MNFDLDARTASLSVGEFAGFSIGPRESGDGPQGLWRAQLGVHWHQELRARATDEVPGAEFEVPIDGAVVHRGWTLTLTGRIDQWFPPSTPSPAPTGVTSPAGLLREIKTVLQPLPAVEAELRADYPDYFAQLATYVALRRLAAPGVPLRAELVFVEAGSGLAQTLPLTLADEALFQSRLERVVEFLDLRARARERLRHLHFRPAFATPRPGQETTEAELHAAFTRYPAVLFEAPTGFGKTGVLLEFALGQLRTGHFDRVLYLTSKATGQLQVVRTLHAMTAPDDASSTLTPVAAWHVRNKAEHCVNHTFHCVRDNCAYLQDIAARWPASGLSRFYLFDHQAHDLDALRDAGRHARICPYEITRTALAFNDVWIGDYNYVFAPRNRGLFFDQPGFDPARTLLLIDEAHNLPARVADAYSHVVLADEARPLLAELDHQHAPAPFVRAWENWTQLLAALPACEVLDLALEADVIDSLDQIVRQLQHASLDYAALGPVLSELLWRSQTLAEWLADASFDKILWCPRPGELRFTCLNAAHAIGATLRAFGGVVCASATFGPPAEFADACGFTTAAEASPDRITASPELALPGAAAGTGFVHLRAHTPWRDAAYDVAIDTRVDTTYQRRAACAGITADTLVRLHASAGSAVAVFFPSYAYAESIVRELDRRGAPLRIVVQPRLPDLAAQAAWVEESLAFNDAIFLVLGSSFAESIDLLGGRITHAMVVGPALPEVNAVQRARLAAFSSLGREAAFRRVYQIPGMQKVNQALGRLVRAPGQRAKVLLHCRRFADPGYARLLAPEYQFGTNLLDDADLAAWLAATPANPSAEPASVQPR